jgi:hypothetical protein
MHAATTTTTSIRSLAKAALLMSDVGEDVASSETSEQESSSSSAVVVSSKTPGYVEEDETKFEFYTDIILGCAFLITALVAAQRIVMSRRQAGGSHGASQGGGSSGGGGGAETTVVTAFYSLICLTSILRCLWFLIPSRIWQPSYTPIAVAAWDAEHPAWVGAMLSEVTVTAGSLTLFAIFILILVYWADILKKYFHPGARRSLPMITFVGLVATLVALELVNVLFFLFGFYTTEGMILFDAILLAIVSIICVCEITIFSHWFRTVLRTLGAINQVSTDSQVKRIVWITVTGNLFFFTRAFLETVFAVLLILWWHETGHVDKAFSHKWWDAYTLIKYVSELTILALMLYILQSRFSAATSTSSTAATSSESTPLVKGQQQQSLNV